MAQKRFLIDAGFETNADSVITGNLTVDTVLLDGQDLASAIASASGGAVAQSVSKSGDTMTGDLTMSAHIIPSIDSDGTTGYDLGSPTMKWRDLYLSEGSLYIDGQKVIESNSGTIVVQADVNQSLTTQVTGTGVLTLASASTVNVAATLQMASGKKITDADGTAVKFGDKVDMDNNQIINLAAPTEDGHATNKTYVDAAINGLINGAPGALDTLNELATALGDDANFAATITNSISVAADGATIKADAAEAAAIAAAASYTDTAITNNVDFTGYAQESYVDTAEADAVSAAATDATTKADAAQSAAATDATTKADAAQSAAATDATTKADAAQSAAATDATTKADAALVSAKSYADTAEATAASDATTKANAAQAAAIAAVTNGAGAAFDTLVEIQNAMATDAELSSAISSVTSSAAATASADATTKADAAELAAIASAEAKDVVRASAANSYADAAELAAINAAESKDATRAATASADATTKANAAQSAAAADATSKANAARAGAVADVTNGAGAAFNTLKEIQDAMATDSELSSAIASVTSSAASTASADATSKANAAQSAAATDATTKANAALVSAKAYADQAEADAESAAASDATTKANAAQAGAIAQLSHFHSAVQNVTASQETNNTTSTTNFTFSELSSAKHYVVLVNRLFLRASEYSVSGTTVTISQGIIAEDDEIEVTGLSS